MSSQSTRRITRLHFYSQNRDSSGTPRRCGDDDPSKNARLRTLRIIDRSRGSGPIPSSPEPLQQSIPVHQVLPHRQTAPPPHGGISSEVSIFNGKEVDPVMAGLRNSVSSDDVGGGRKGPSNSGIGFSSGTEMERGDSVGHKERGGEVVMVPPSLATGKAFDVARAVNRGGVCGRVETVKDSKARERKLTRVSGSTTGSRV
ncbi:hypothetical protein BC829DRAFT_414898 [Chytridium lagenaria]|nr:hypothetical protein BC829DRAFT_414898 [Chytridium lagenaria]